MLAWTIEAGRAMVHRWTVRNSWRSWRGRAPTMSKDDLVDPLALREKAARWRDRFCKQVNRD